MLWMLVIAVAAPLVHDPGDTDAAERAREAGVTEPLEPVSLDDIRTTAPWSRNGQPIDNCAPGPIAADAIRGHLLYGELDAARQRLATERMQCDGTAAQRAELERAAGLLALMAGDEATARHAFAVAKGYDPELPWDDGFPADQQALFDAVEPLVATLVVAPVPDAMDGAPPTAGPVAAGSHGLVLGATRLHLRHSDVDDVLAVPGAYPLALPSLADEASRLALTHVLSARLGVGERVHVAGPEALWTGTTGRTDWTPTPWPAPPAPDPEPVATVKRSPAPWLVAGGGAVVAVAGGLLAGVSASQAQGFATDMADTTDRSVYDELATKGEGANGRVRIGQGLLLGGAGLTTVGLVWGVAR